MKINSTVEQLRCVSFSDFTNERIYMINIGAGLPKTLKRWSKTIDEMTIGLEVKNDMYLMVDQSFVDAGSFHRRPGLHIDGYWTGIDHGHRIDYSEEMILSDLATAMNASMLVCGLPPGEKKHEAMSANNCSETAERMTVEELREGLKHV